MSFHATGYSLSEQLNIVPMKPKYFDLCILPLFSCLIVCIWNVFSHRGLKIDGAIGQGEICNSLKSENFSKSFLSHIGKNKVKF